MKWIKIALVVATVCSALLLVFKPKAAGELVTTGKTADEVVADVLERSEQITSHPLGIILVGDGGLSGEIEQMKEMRDALTDAEQRGKQARKVIEYAASVDNWVYSRLRRLDFHIPVIIGGFYFCIIGMLGIWAGVPKNGTTGVLMGCAAPLVTQEFLPLVVSAPMFIVAVIFGLVGDRRYRQHPNMPRAANMVVLALLVLVAACAPERDFTLEKKVRDADALAEQLEGDELDDALDRIAKDTDKPLDLGGRLFPIQKAEAKCGNTSLAVLYNPYRHAFVMTFRNDRSLNEEIRSIEINGNELFAAERAFKGRDYVGSKPGSVAKQGLYDVIDKHPEVFVAGTDVTLRIRANAMSARKKGSKAFAYKPFVHDNWQVSLHVFSAEETKTIDAYGKKVRRAVAMQTHIANLQRDARLLGDGDHPRITEVIELLNQRAAQAEQAVHDLGEAPLAELRDRLSVRSTKCKS